MRLELVTPASDLVSPHTYNELFSMHGIIMVWFFLIPSIPNTLGNFLIPLMIGAKDLASRKINLASWYVFMLGGTVTLYSMFRGGVDTGWTFYTPFSTIYSNTCVVGAALGIFISGFASIMTGLNFIATIHNMRAPGMTWFRLPLFIWSHYATSVIFVLATPVLAVTLLMVAVKFTEYYQHYQAHKVPGIWFETSKPDAGAMQLFYVFYFAMTGLHALHMTIGITLVVIYAFRAAFGSFNSEYHTPLEALGLYWHFVDIVWVFLFAIFYISGLHT